MVSICLRISGDSLSPEIVESKLKTIPDKVTLKDGKNVVESTWMKKIRINDNDDLNNKIAGFLEQFNCKGMSELAKMYDITLWISSYPDYFETNLHLTSEVVKLVAEMSISLDVSTAFLDYVVDMVSD